MTCKRKAGKAKQVQFPFLLHIQNITRRCDRFHAVLCFLRGNKKHIARSNPQIKEQKKTEKQSLNDLHNKNKQKKANTPLNTG